MNSLLNKEKLLFDTLYSKVLDRSFVIAFQDYIGFLAEHGTDLLLHLGTDIIARKQRLETLEKQRDELLKEIIKIQSKFNKIADKLDVKEDPVIASSIEDLDSLLDGSTTVIGGNRFDTMQSEIFDFVRRLIELEYYDEANEFLDQKIESTNQLSDKKITVTKNIKAYLGAEEVFMRQDISDYAGALTRLTEGYQEMIYFSNNSISFDATTKNFMGKLLENSRHKEYAKLMSGDIRSSDYFGRRRFHSDLERIHNSIIMNNDEDDTKETVANSIFYLKDGNIYHHSKSEKLTYKLRGEGDPMYIKLFKNILKYMPANQEKISIKKFKELLPPDERSSDKYRSNVGKSAKSFHNFLKDNGVDNLRPDTREMVLEATDDYITFRNNL
ncbi:MAG: hypothetical protein H6780_02765 [Candidatus Nomurabacteria bacterium]|nr:MAG: hypothetical protein H6780_02765 [Candidatus Nomurabacteria bacterium]